jgi:hypothetical protein
MTNRREILSRIERCRIAMVPITNYGVVIAYSLGKFERALKPFANGLDYFVKTGKKNGLSSSAQRRFTPSGTRSGTS